MDTVAYGTRRPLVIASAAYLAANLLHGADHFRQHMAGLDVETTAGGGLLTLAAVVVVVMAVRRHPRAPLAATVVGFASAVLVVSAHLLPHWSVFSDSYVNDIHPDALSWVVVLVEIAAAVFLGVVGLVHLRSKEAVGMDRRNHFRVSECAVAAEPLLDGQDYSYADSFELVLDRPDHHSAPEWLRVSVEHASPAVMALVAFVHVRVAGFRLHAGDAASSLRGWRIAAIDDDHAALEASGSLLRAVIVARRSSPTRLTFTTFLFYKRSRAATIWRFVRPLHQRVSRYLLANAATVMTRDQPSPLAAAAAAR